MAGAAASDAVAGFFAIGFAFDSGGIGALADADAGFMAFRLVPRAPFFFQKLIPQFFDGDSPQFGFAIQFCDHCHHADGTFEGVVHGIRA